MRNCLKSLVLLNALAACLVVLAACGQDPQTKTAESEETAAKATKTQLPPGPAPEIISVSGKVLDVLDGGNFIFVLIDRGEEQSWATVPATELQAGESVSLENATLFGKFYSKSLDRTFESLIFSSGIAGKEPRRMVGSSTDPGQRRSGRLLAAGGGQLPGTQETK